VRVVNHTLLLIRSGSRFSTNVRFSDLNLQRRTLATLTITESLWAVTRVRNKSHTTPDKGVTKFTTNERSVHLTLTDALFEDHQVFLGGDSCV